MVVVPVLAAAHESAEFSGLRVHQVSASISLRRLVPVRRRVRRGAGDGGRRRGRGPVVMLVVACPVPGQGPSRCVARAVVMMK